MKGQWILCKDRLPFAEYGESEKMLTTCTNGDCRWIECLYFNGGVWCYPTGEPYEYGQVIAWMPLPAPYEGEVNKEK